MTNGVRDWDSRDKCEIFQNDSAVFWRSFLATEFGWWSLRRLLYSSDSVRILSFTMLITASLWINQYGTNFRAFEFYFNNLFWHIWTFKRFNHKNLTFYRRFFEDCCIDSMIKYIIRKDNFGLASFLITIC